MWHLHRSSGRRWLIGLNPLAHPDAAWLYDLLVRIAGVAAAIASLLVLLILIQQMSDLM